MDASDDDKLNLDEAARKEREVLARLLSTPPDPKTRREPSATPKKRGRPKAESKESKDRK
jgi:hypothetical protein